MYPATGQVPEQVPHWMQVHSGFPSAADKRFEISSANVRLADIGFHLAPNKGRLRRIGTLLRLSLRAELHGLIRASFSGLCGLQQAVDLLQQHLGFHWFLDQFIHRYKPRMYRLASEEKSDLFSNARDDQYRHFPRFGVLSELARDHDAFRPTPHHDVK